MSVTKVLLDVLVVLLAAKAAAEVAERVKVPAVVGEILAGILIGPSLLGLVHGEDVLRVLGELGVILLLLEVGMEMDLRQMAAVGRASLAVATVGVVVPFAGGYVVASALGLHGNEVLFVSAALTATSVGITARVFGDLRALASVEARTVLGAAVADDVMGLVILTVVVRIASEGSVSALAVAGIVLVAVGFLTVTAALGIRLAPPTFAFVARASRSSGTLVAMGLAFTLAASLLRLGSRSRRNRRASRSSRPASAGPSMPPTSCRRTSPSSGIGFVAFFAVGFAFMFGGFSFPGVFGMDNPVGGALIGSGDAVFLWKGGFFLGGKAYDVSVLAFFLYMVAFMDTVATIPTKAMAERWKWKAFVHSPTLLWGDLLPVVRCVDLGWWLAGPSRRQCRPRSRLCRLRRLRRGAHDGRRRRSGRGARARSPCRERSRTS